MQNNSGYTRLYTHMVFNTLPIDVFQSIHVFSQLTKAHCLVVSLLFRVNKMQQLRQFLTDQ